MSNLCEAHHGSGAGRRTWHQDWPRSLQRYGAPCAVRAPRERPRTAMQAALHAATATLPASAQGLTGRTAERAVPHLRALTGAAAIALADTARGAGDRRRGSRAGPARRPALASARARPGRPHCTSCRGSSPPIPTCPLRSAVLAPLIAQDRRIGTLIAFYRSVGPPQPRTSCGWYRRRRVSSRPRSSCRLSPRRRSGSRRPSCARCEPRSRPTSSTTRWRRSPATSTPGQRRRATC